ncbi:MAG: DNA primase [Alphaproteobacteria bacterium]|nr:DNA primase [Rickettsiales bacterium]
MNSWKDFTEQVRSVVKLSNIVSRYAKLESNGSHKYKCKCPFHSEKTASFHIDDQKGAFHCFGCHVYGDVFNFVQKKDGIVDFKNAVKELARRFSIPIPEYKAYNSSDLSKFSAMYDTLEKATLFFKNCLKSQENVFAMNYLRGKRKLDSDVIDEFNIGFAPAGFNSLSLVSYLRQLGCKDTWIIATGLARDRNGSLLDFFYNRIMIPITDKNSKVIGFGGRLINDSPNAPKYLNTSDKELFRKGNILFNFARARLSFFTTKQHILVVEGYMDVIAMSMIGYKSCVAPLGTAITVGQIRLILSIDKSPIVCFNSDNAGVNAACRCAKICLPLLSAGTVVRFAFPIDQQAKDLDDVRVAAGSKKNAKLKLQTIINSSLELQDFLWNDMVKGFDLQNANELAKLEKLVREMVTSINDEDVKVSYKNFFKSKMYTLYRQKQSSNFKQNNTNKLLITNKRVRKIYDKDDSIVCFGKNNILSNSNITPDSSTFQKSPLYRSVGILYMVCKFPYLFTNSFNFCAKDSKNQLKDFVIKIGSSSVDFSNVDLSCILLDIEKSANIAPEELKDEINAEIGNILTAAEKDFKTFDRGDIVGLFRFYAEKAYDDLIYEDVILNTEIVNSLHKYANQNYRSQDAFTNFVRDVLLYPKKQLQITVLTLYIDNLDREIEQQDVNNADFAAINNKLKNELIANREKLIKLTEYNRED